MSEPQTTPAVWGVIGAVIAGVIVAIVSAWLSAEASRAEALRSERRTAYAELIGAANQCQATFFDIDLQDLAIRPQDDPVTLGQRRIADIGRCSVQLLSSGAKVRLLSGSDEFISSTNALIWATLEIDTTDKEGGNGTANYIQALAEFEVRAGADANGRIISPLTLRLIAVTLVEAMVIALFVFWRRSLGMPQTLLQ